MAVSNKVLTEKDVKRILTGLSKKDENHKCIVMLGGKCPECGKQDPDWPVDESWKE